MIENKLFYGAGKKPLRDFMIERTENNDKKSPMQLRQERIEKDYAELKERLLAGEVLENSIDLPISIRDLHQMLMKEGYNALISPPITKGDKTRLRIVK